MKRFEEPIRWLDPRSDASSEVRSLLAQGRDALGPTPDDLARLGASVARAVAGGAAAGAAKAAAVHAGHALTRAGALKLAAVLAVGGVGAGIGWSVLHSTEAPPAVSVAAPASTTAFATASADRTPEPRLAPTEQDAAVVPAVSAAPAVPSPPSVRSAAPLLPAATPSVAAIASSPASVSLENAPTPGAAAPAAQSELALLDQARAALATDPAGAMRALDAHRALYPQGTFAQEREVLAIEALVRLGRRPEAEARAAAFARQFPGSAHARRIAVLLGQDAGAP